jgi:hypothetical protein
MRFLKILGILLCMMTLVSVAAAGGEKLGIRNSYHVSFDTPVRVGTTLLPAGDYTIRHTMEGQDHVMAFKRGGSKDVVKVKCTLVQLTEKANQSQTTFVVNAANEKVLQEMVFRGDTAKHVF